jgi:phosphoribosylformylglycinamidine (FGAM) synthase-like enzyme
MAEEIHNDLFSKLGIDIGDEKINIDLAQTKGFFEALQQTLQQKAEKLQSDISEGKVDLAEEVGIKVDDQRVEIDLAKTKSFIEELGSKIQSFVADLEKSVEKISNPKNDTKS